MILSVIFISLTITSALNYFKTRKKRALIANIRGPPSLPLIGSVQKFIFLTPQNFLDKSRLYIEKYGSLSRCWVFDRLFILITDYEFAEQLLQHPEYLKTGYNLLRPLHGAGVLGSDGDRWQQRRQLVSHAFRPHILADFLAVFVAQAEVLQASLQPLSDGKSSFDIYPHIFRTMLDTMAVTALGIERSAERDASTEYAEAVKDVVELFTERFLSLHSANATIYSLMCPRLKRKQKRLLATINRINSALIAEQRVTARQALKLDETLNAAIYTIQMEEQSPARGHDTLLDALLASTVAGEPLTNADICDELNTAVFQGSLLSASTTSFALVMIARHPSVQQQLLEELQSVWPKDEARQYTTEQLHKLQYLECVLQETMRLYPAQPILARDLAQDFPYSHSKVGDGVIPADAELYINVFEMLRQSEKFDEPDVFRPERHQCSASAEWKNLLTFSMGPRSCLAQKFAMLLMKTVIAELLTAYEVLPFGEELRLEVKIVLKSTNGFQIGLKPRSY